MGHRKRRREGPRSPVVAVEAIGSGIAAEVLGTSRRKKSEVVPTRGVRQRTLDRPNQHG